MNRCQDSSFANLIQIIAEHPILGYNNYNIGFVDAKIILNSYISNIDEEKSGCKFLYQLLKLDDQEDLVTNSFYVKIKPKVTSIGELIRQINLYRSHVNDGTWIVITETPNLDEVLGSQNILYYQLTNQLGTTS